MISVERGCENRRQAQNVVIWKGEEKGDGPILGEHDKTFGERNEKRCLSFAGVPRK